MSDKDFNSRLRQAQLNALMRSVGWKGALWIALIAAGIAVFFWLQTSRSGASTIATAAVYGTIESGFTHQSERGAEATRISVRLDSGQLASTTLPRSLAFIPGARVKLAAQQKEANGTTWLDYQFLEYDSPDQQRTPRNQ